MLNRFSLQSLLASAVALLLAAAPAAAQGTDGTRIGIGVSISDVSTIFADVGEGGLGFVPIPSVLVPIDVNEALRIEPVVGYTRLSSETSFGGDETSTTTNILRLGIGFFGKSMRGGDTNLYYGARAGYNRLKTSEDDEDDEEEALDGFFVGPTVGGSYFFSDFFSIGGEVEARYTSFSEGEGDAEITNSTITLRPALVVRFYF